jgi:tripartite-type tricarboxylate transporter receptor subunit TctC
MKLKLMSIAAAAAVAGGVALAVPAAAQDWPQKPITAVVPFPPGSSSDAVVRLLAEHLSPRLGQPVVIDNRPGAGGTIGATSLSRSDADGYTFGLLSTSTATVAPNLRPNLAYNPLKDFSLLGMVGGAPYIVVIYPGLPIKNLQGLIDYAKANPGKLNYGSAGVTSLANLATVSFAQTTGIDIKHVPYKAAAQTVPDMLSGRLEMQFATIAVARPSVEGGKLRALAVTSPKRLPIFPDVPTVMEAGVPDFSATLWFVLAMPAGVPDAIVTRFNRALNEVLSSEKGRTGLLGFGLAAEPGPPGAARDQIVREMKRWGEVAGRAGLLPPKK